MTRVVKSAKLTPYALSLECGARPTVWLEPWESVPTEWPCKCLACLCNKVMPAIPPSAPTHIAILDDQTCEGCRQVHGKPSTFHVLCTNPNGCRCVLEARP